MSLLNIKSKIDLVDFVDLAAFLKSNIHEPSNFYDIEAHLCTYLRDIILSPDILSYIMSILVDLGIVIQVGKACWFRRGVNPKILKIWGIEVPDISQLETRT